MMVPKKSLFLAGAALALVGAAGAQSQSGKVFARYNKPLRTASLDLATGTVTRGPAVQQQVATTISDFPNIDLGGFIGADTGGGFCEWYDGGVKGTVPNASDLMRNFVIAYCSAALDVNSGGVGGTVGLGFYEGYVSTSTAVDPGPGVANFTLSGLPANTAFSSPFLVGGGTACFFLNVTFTNLVPFADGAIGYSWHFIDIDATGVLGATIPFLACVSSCSGPGPDSLGMIDFIDEYCPADPGPGGTPVLAHFTFGTTIYGSYFTSMSMDIRELADCTAANVSYNSTSPANVDVLTSTPAIIGTTWSAEVTHAAGTATFSTLLVRGSKIPGNGAPAGSKGRLLVTGAFFSDVLGVNDTIPPILASQKNFSAGIPLQFSLACIDWFAQAVTGGSGAQKLSNGIDGDTGTQ